MHQSPGNEHHQGDQGDAGDEIKRALIQRFGCETGDELADDPGDEQLRSYQTQHGQGSKKDQTGILFCKFSKQSERFHD